MRSTGARLARAASRSLGVASADAGIASQSRRFSSSASTSAPAALVYATHGPPETALSLVPQEPPSGSTPPAGTARVRWLLAPVNWSDVNVVEGTYPGAPAPPATPGNEGVGVVDAVGPRLSSEDEDDLGDRPLKPGDVVVPLSPGLGTWRSVAEGVPTAALWRVPGASAEGGTQSGGLSLDQAATLCINPPTALHLLDDFVPLPPGACLIQTGGTTAVGRLVIQAAAARGVRTISIIRDRADPAEAESVKASLKALGADAVLTEAEAGVKGGRARRPAVPLPPPGLPAPTLALDCVGGGPGVAAVRALAPGGTLVVYGGLSRSPVTLPASALIFKDVRVRGFWLSGPATGGGGGSGPGGGPAARAARAATLARAADLISKGVLSTPVQRVPLKRWQDALAALRTGGAGVGGRKQVLELQG